jgi:uncharacterized membrane protein YfcA
VIEASAIDLALLAVVGVLAGWINTIAGAGSLLLLPALVFTGLPADAANATNRLGILATTSAALVGYRRAGLSIGRSEIVLTLAAMIGGLGGAYVATLLGAEEMRIAIVVAMGVMLVLSLVPAKKKDAGPSPVPDREREGANALPSPTPAMVAAFVGIGVYGGFLQAGLGIVVLLYLSLAHGVSLVASNVVKTTATLGLTIVAIAIFAWRGETIDLVRGGVLAASSAVGGLFGAKATVALGDRFVRVAVALAVIASMAKLVWDAL